MRQLRAQRRAEARIDSGGHQGGGRAPGRARLRRVRQGHGQARSAGKRGAGARLRRVRGMKTVAPERVDFPVSGMTCAACARTIERTLSGTSGVERASVNLATNTATVEYDPGQVQPRDFVAAIEDLGYGVPKTEVRADAEAPALRRRFLVAAVLAAPVIWLGMSHRAPMVQLLLTIPVIFYSGAPFYIAAWKALLHRSLNMNTLVSLGTGAAFLYSVVQALLGRHEVYFEAAAAIVALILLGRMLEMRARGRAS